MVCLERRDENLSGSHVFMEASPGSYGCKAQGVACNGNSAHSSGSAIETGQVAGDEVVNPILKWLFPAPKLKPKDAVIGAVGALIAIGVTYWVSDQLIDIEKAPILALAMGASAIIIFMTPRGPMAQPGPVLLAHTIGAIVGVTAYKLVDNVILASGIAVAVTALVITTLGCTHPPSGGTAISAVIGSSTITDLGYEYVWRPVLLNAVLLVVLAIVLNAPFADRRYPLPFAKSS